MVIISTACFVLRWVPTFLAFYSPNNNQLIFFIRWKTDRYQPNPAPAPPPSTDIGKRFRSATIISDPQNTSSFLNFPPIFSKFAPKKSFEKKIWSRLKRKLPPTNQCCSYLSSSSQQARDLSLNKKITLQSFTPKNRTEWSRARFRQKPAFRFISSWASLVIFFTDIIFFPRHRFRRRQWPPNLPPPTLRFSSKLNPSWVRSHWKIGLKGVGQKSLFFNIL